MGLFVNEVRSRKVVSPLQEQFDRATWIEAGRTLIKEDPVDLELLNLGLTFDLKLKRLWQRFDKLQLPRFPGKELRRIYVAMINRDFSTLRGKVEEKFNESTAHGPPLLEELLSTKVSGALNGCDYTADDIAAAEVDGLKMLLQKSFAQIMDGSGELDLSVLGTAIGLGQVHSFTTGLWEECLWGLHKLGHSKKVISFVPNDDERSQIRAVGYSRLLALHSQMNSWGAHLWQHMSDVERSAIAKTRWNVRVNGTGPKLRIHLTPAQPDPYSPVASFAMRIIATELYFGELFETELPKLPGVTPSLLLSAWEILYGVAHALAERMRTDVDILVIRNLWQFAPVIPVPLLCDVLSKGLEISKEQSSAIIEFLTFSETQSEELWARPLVKLDAQTVTPVLTCLYSPNPLRMVELWMKYGKLDLQSKGHSFEKNIREHLSSALSESRILGGAGVCSHPYKLPIRKNDNPGDIDIIVWFGRTILIAEAKCTLFPANGREFHNYIKVLEKAGDQIARKATALRLDLDRFWREIVKREPPSQTHIVPLILSNLPLGVGLRFSEIPVVDLLILERFLGEGSLSRFVKFDSRSGPSVGEEVVFYRSLEEAEDVVANYLSEPPQLSHFKAGLVFVPNILPPFDESESAWLVFDHQVDFSGFGKKGLRAGRENLLPTTLPSRVLRGLSPRPLEGRIEI